MAGRLLVISSETANANQHHLLSQRSKGYHPTLAWWRSPLHPLRRMERQHISHGCKNKNIHRPSVCVAMPPGEGEVESARLEVERSNSLLEDALRNLESVVSRRPSSSTQGLALGVAGGFTADSLWEDVGGMDAAEPEYEFTAEQEVVILELESAMTKAATAALWLAASEVFMTMAFAVGQSSLLDAVAGMSDCVHEVVGAALIYVAARSFRKVATTAGKDVSCLLNGLEQLSFAFHELGIINVALAIMQISTAAALWPKSTLYIGGLSVVVTFARFIIHVHPEVFDEMTRLNERVEGVVTQLRTGLGRLTWWAHKEVGATVAAPLPPHNTPPEVDESPPEYEFNRQEEQVFRNIVAALHIATIAKLLQALGETVLMGANMAINNRTQAFASLFDLLEELSAAGFMSRASLALDRVITTSGRDITNTMEGLGSQSGLARLFNQLAQASCLLSIAQVAQGAFALLQHVPNTAVKAAVASLSSLWAGGAAGIIITFFTMWMQVQPS